MNDTPEEPVCEDADVMFINRCKRIAVLTDANSVPITHFFDKMGEDCEPDDAVSCVAGSEKYGWFIVDLENFCYMAVH